MVARYLLTQISPKGLFHGGVKSCMLLQETSFLLKVLVLFGNQLKSSYDWASTQGLKNT